LPDWPRCIAWSIEGAGGGGPNAARAICDRHGRGEAIQIIEPDAYPALPLAALALATMLLAYAAKAVSIGDGMLRQAYRSMFPNG
jgi:hypothetical protein